MTSVQVLQIQVTCIRLAGPGPRRFESITHIGAGGRIWAKSEAISAIQAGRVNFYTSVGGRTAVVRVVTQNGADYLRTWADGFYNNNLEALPDCS